MCKGCELIVNYRYDLVLFFPSDACDLTLDPDTAHPKLILSDGNKKARHGEQQSYPDLPQRFDSLPQVLCREALTGRHYWEVELCSKKGADAAAAVCYGGLQRKGDGKQCGIGWNDMSWSVGHKWSPSPNFYVEHNRNEDFNFNHIPPPTGSARLGVYLDHAAGSLSFYEVTGDKLRHIHTFYSQFSEPVYPCFKIWENSDAFLCL